MDTILVCSKCGKTETLDNAKKAGWLVARRAGGKEGHLVIRCNEHVTGHALRLAGLPQQVDSKRVQSNIGQGLYTNYNDYYMAIASEVEADYDREHGYSLSFHDGEMPAFNTLTFSTLPALIAEMRHTEPDLRKWKKVMTE